MDLAYIEYASYTIPEVAVYINLGGTMLCRNILGAFCGGVLGLLCVGWLYPQGLAVVSIAGVCGCLVGSVCGYFYRELPRLVHLQYRNVLTGLTLPKPAWPAWIKKRGNQLLLFRVSAVTTAWLATLSVFFLGIGALYYLEQFVNMVPWRNIFGFNSPHLGTQLAGRFSLMIMSVLFMLTIVIPFFCAFVGMILTLIPSRDYRRKRNYESARLFLKGRLGRLWTEEAIWLLWTNFRLVAVVSVFLETLLWGFVVTVFIPMIPFIIALTFGKTIYHLTRINRHWTACGSALLGTAVTAYFGTGYLQGPYLYAAALVSGSLSALAALLILSLRQVCPSYWAWVSRSLTVNWDQLTFLPLDVSERARNQFTSRLESIFPTLRAIPTPFD